MTSTPHWRRARVRHIAADRPDTAGEGVRNEDRLTLLDRERRRAAPQHRLAAGLAAAAVVLLAAGVVAVVRSGEARTLTAARRTTAAGYSRALLTELPLPPGATGASGPPNPELRQSPLTGNGILDARVAWWTVPGSFSTAVARQGSAALPAYWRMTATSTGGAGPRSYGSVIEVRDPRARFVSSIIITFAAPGQAVGMVVQINTYAIAVRTPPQVIPSSIDAATFAVSGGGGRSYSSTLSLHINGRQVSTLVGQINAAPTFVVLTVASCPAPLGSVAVTFRSAGERWLLQISNGSPLCNTPTLTGANGRSIGLTASDALLTDVLAAAGLPRDYLDR